MATKGNLDVDVFLKKTSTRNINHYLPSLTALRGIAALWVMLFHIDVIIFYRELGAIFPHELSGLITQGYLWVDFFFILSGFIIFHIYGPQLSTSFQISHIKEYLIARFFRIYPLHLFTLALLIMLVIITSSLAPVVIDDSWRLYFDWHALLSNIFLTNAMNQHTYLSWNIVSWSIGAEWWTYIYAIGLLYLISNKSEKTVLTVATLSLAGLILLVYFYPKNSLDITFDFGFLRCLFEFTIGITTYKLFKTGLGRTIFQKDRCFALTLLALIAVFHWKLNDLLTIPLFSILTLCAAFNKRKISRLLAKPIWQYLGRISYSIYLMHGVWFMVFWFSLPVLKNTWVIESFSVEQITLYALTFIALTIISSIYSHRYIEVPFRYSFNAKQLLEDNSPLATMNK